MTKYFCCYYDAWVHRKASGTIEAENLREAYKEAEETSKEIGLPLVSIKEVSQ